MSIFLSFEEAFAVRPCGAFLFMIDEQTITKCRNTDIVSFVGKFVKLKKNGVNYTGLCPFHDERTASFTVSPSKYIYKCFGCGSSGDVVDFVMKHEKMSFYDAIGFIAGHENIELIPTEKYIKPNIKEYKIPPQEIGNLSTLAITYFNRRGISEQTLRAMNITDGVEWMPKAMAAIPVIKFNYFTMGIVANIKYRGKNKDFKMHKDAKPIMYNLDKVYGADHVFIVEGEIDAASLWECGIKTVVSVPNGAPPDGAKIGLEYLVNSMPYLSCAKKFILFTDNDKVGRWLRDALVKFLSPEKCFTVKYFGFKDANEMLVTKGAEYLYRTCQNVIPIPKKPQHPFYLRKYLLKYIHSQTLRKYYQQYGLSTFKGRTDYKIQVDNKALAFLMWIISPEYTWTINDGDEYFNEEKCMFFIPDNAFIEEIKGQRLWIDKTYGLPLDML
jgi:5S rRNA maturation endonuclease (ribonuclease M5)